MAHEILRAYQLPSVRAPFMISPTLIIHGTDDEIIDGVHAQQLYELIPNKLEPLFIRGAGHNNCELYEEYLIRLEYLVHVELVNSNLINNNQEALEPNSTLYNGTHKFPCFGSNLSGKISCRKLPSTGSVASTSVNVSSVSVPPHPNDSGNQLTFRRPRFLYHYPNCFRNISKR